jgi:putative redox protein
MATSSIKYVGDLRTVCIHLQSGTQILTDAPTDNHGKGEAFSPTDLVATALGSCMVSIMAIKSKDLNVDLLDSTVEVTKIMQAEPRKIAKIIVVLNMSITPDDKTKIILERAAMTCPVFLSLHPDIEKEITFNWK